jgi:hypothetical protein
VARTARLIAVTMLCSAVVALTGFAIGAAAIVWAALIAGRVNCGAFVDLVISRGQAGAMGRGCGTAAP